MKNAVQWSSDPMNSVQRISPSVAGANIRRREMLIAAGAACVAVPDALSASREVVIAQVAPFSGPLAVYSEDIARGAEACFAAFNRRTSKGVQVRLVKADDQGDSARTVQLFKETARKERPLAFIYPLAPPAIEAVLAEKLPRQLGIPLLGTVPSLQKVPGAVDPYVFHLGAAESIEINKILEHAATVNLRELAVVYWDTPGVRALVDDAKAIAGTHGVNLISLVLAKSTEQSDPKALAQQISSAQPTAILCLLPINEMATFMRALRGLGKQTVVYSLSFVDAVALFRLAGPDAAAGVCLSQHLPNPYDRRRPVVAQFQADMRLANVSELAVNTMSFEGYLSARVITSALDRMGDSPMPDQLRDGIEGLRNLDLGGFSVSYGPQKRAGSNYVDIGVVTRAGKLMY